MLQLHAIFTNQSKIEHCIWEEEKVYSYSFYKVFNAFRKLVHSTRKKEVVKKNTHRIIRESRRKKYFRLFRHTQFVMSCWWNIHYENTLSIDNLLVNTGTEVEIETETETEAETEKKI